MSLVDNDVLSHLVLGRGEGEAEVEAKVEACGAPSPAVGGSGFTWSCSRKDDTQEDDSGDSPNRA